MPTLGLSLSSASAVTNILQSLTPLSPLGFPLRIKVTSSDLGITDNLIKVEETSTYVTYGGSNVSLLWGKNNPENYGEIITEGDISSFYPSWTAGTTTLPRTGWQDGFVVSEATPSSVTITATTPQTFTYNASIPSIAFSNNQSLNNNFFSFSPAISASAGTRSTTISLVDDPDYVAANSPSVSYTINKKNVTIALTNQNSTFAPNQAYNAVTPVAITGLAGSDTISGSFGSLLTGMPATGANAGSYTLSLNPSYTSTNYSITNSPASVTWTISKANQTITFNPTLAGTNGSTQSLSASSTSGLSVTYSVVSGPATLNGSTLTYTGTGNVVVRASQAGNTNYNPATNVDRTIAVTAPVSSLPNSVVISGNATFNGTAVKKVVGERVLGVPQGGGSLFVDSGTAYAYGLSENYGTILIPPQTTITDTYGIHLNTPSSTWRLVVSNYDGGNDSYDIVSIANNPSTDPTTIPTTGWTPSLTITLPSSGIPVSTNTITMNGGYQPSSTFTKVATNAFALCNYTEGQLEGSITFNHRWMYSGGGWYDIEIGLATRKTSGSSLGRTFIYATNGNICSSTATSPTWVILYNTGDEYGPNAWTIATNPSQDFNNIPTTGWVIYDSADAASITITAPPAGIPTASTTTVNINMISSYGFEGGFNKGSPDSWFGPEGDYYLLFTGTRWEITGYGDVIAFNTSASQTVNYIPQTGWNVSVTITTV
jgi:hypothetical protein